MNYPKPTSFSTFARTLFTLLTRRIWVVLLVSQYGIISTVQANEGEGAPIIAMNTDEALSSELLKAYQDMGSDYEPRTEHFGADGTPKYINRLIQEDSPYLVQHAHNPVNWYPWGSEAFEVAAAEQKPIFLSIGYATCHWCHVMERESFENEDIAGLMNEHYISIKVDREQLPDVDALYMSAVMLVNGNGGWPMSSFLDVKGRTFYGATYFPPDQFAQILQRIETLWREQRPALMDQAAQITNAVNLNSQTSSEAIDVGFREISRGLQSAQEGFDRIKGGFGGAPKFPRESTLYFLLDQAMRSLPDQLEDDYSSLSMADNTLQKMAAGGIHDHVGGGFHRYAVDSQWLVPHFEKMLYNQAALARNYSQAYQLTGNEDHQRTAERILDYVLRDMTSENGMFYSATDADSEGEEGLFFVWNPEELTELLGEKDGSIAAELWKVTSEGNFEGTSILHTPESIESVAAQFDMSANELIEKVDQWTETMRAARELREHPLRDEKMIGSWNGMMISALAKGTDRLGSERYLNAAITAAESLWTNLKKPDGTLYRIYYNGQTSIDATQADYAYISEAFVALYDATANAAWLERAESLISIMNTKFWDQDNGAYFMGAPSVAGTSLSTRPKDLHDSSIPSGNSVALRVLAQLHKRTGDAKYETNANKLIAALSSRLSQQPSGHYYLLTGVSEHLGGEAGALQYAGRGVVRAKASKRDDELVVSIKLSDGWHINSDAPLQDYLIPTQLNNVAGRPLPDVAYPESKTRTLGFQRSALSLFEDSFELTAQWPGHEDSNSVVVNLQLQACNDEICLAPETLPLTLYY